MKIAVVLFVFFLCQAIAHVGISIVEDSFTDCPNDCSGNGDCVSGICQCNSGFETPDCSLPCGNIGQICCSKDQCNGGFACLSFPQKIDGVCSSFGGAFSNATVNSNPVCISANFFTGNCDCPSSFSPFCYSIDQNLGASDSYLCLCQVNQVGDFGGSYLEINGQCSQPNIISGGCTCPSNTSPNGPLTFINANNEETELYTCVPSSNTVFATYAGSFETNNQSNPCQVSNQYTGDCTCPPMIGESNSLISCPSIILGSDETLINFCSVTPNSYGIVASITQGAFSKLILQQINQTIIASENVKLPDISGHDYKVEDIEFHYIGFQDMTVAVTGYNQIRVNLSQGALDGKIGKIEAHKGILKTHCDAHPFNLEDVNVDALIQVSITFLGGIKQVQLSLISATASVGNVNVEIHGNFICHLFEGDIEKSIRDGVINGFSSNVQKGLSDSLTQSSEYITGLLGNLTDLYPIQSTLVPFTLVADAVPVGCGITVNLGPNDVIASVPLKGSFTSFGTPIANLEAPITGSIEFSSLPPQIRDFQLCISEFSYNSLGWLIYQTGLINTTFSSKDLPPNFPVQLNTSNVIIKQIAPELDSLFPNDGIQLSVACTASLPNTTAPTVTVENTFLSFELESSVTFQVVSEENSQPYCYSDPTSSNYLCDVFTLGAKSSIEVKISLVENATDVSIIPTITNMTFSWSLLNSNVGNIYYVILDTLGNLFIPIVIGELNTRLADADFAFAKQIDVLTLTDFTQFEFVPNTQGGFICIEFDAALN